MNQVTQIQEQSATPVVMQGASLIMLKQQVEQLEACRQLAHHYCNTEMVPKQYRNKPENGAVAIQWGAEIGLAPLQSLQNVAVVNGNPTLWGDALVALVRSSGVCEYISGDYDAIQKVYTVKTKRSGQPEEVNTYSYVDAEQAKLTARDTYKNHLKVMLKNRARAHLLRDVYADVLKGFQIREVAEEDKEVYGLDQVSPTKEMGPAEVVEPDNYPAADFEANFPKWEQVILKNKKSAADLITMIESKAPLTEEQKAQILNVGSNAA